MPFVEKLNDSFNDTPFTLLESHIPELGSGWDDIVGTWQIDGDGISASVNSGSGNNYTFNNTAIGNDQSAEIEIGDATGFIGCGVRCSGTGPGSSAGYFAITSAGNAIYLYRLDNDVFTELTHVSFSYSANQIMLIQVIGNLLTVKVGISVVISDFSDSTYSSGKVGMYGFGVIRAGFSFVGKEFSQQTGLPFMTSIDAKRF